MVFYTFQRSKNANLKKNWGVNVKVSYPVCCTLYAVGCTHDNLSKYYPISMKFFLKVGFDDSLDGIEIGHDRFMASGLDFAFLREFIWELPLIFDRF